MIDYMDHSSRSRHIPIKHERSQEPIAELDSESIPERIFLSGNSEFQDMQGCKPYNKPSMGSTHDSCHKILAL